MKNHNETKLIIKASLESDHFVSDDLIDWYKMTDLQKQYPNTLHEQAKRNILGKSCGNS